VKDAFKAHAIRFVTKPIMCGELFEALDYAIASRKEYPDIVFRAHGRSFRIDPRRVIMLESNRNNVTVYLFEKSAISLNTPLKTLEKMLEPSLFLRVHKSYIVNMQHVKEIEGESLVLTNGLRAAISVRRAHDVMAKFRSFDLGGDPLCT
jgi:DNA-binding LytR/AlgR family response regulator